MSDLIGKIATVTRPIAAGSAGQVTMVSATGFTAYLAIPSIAGTEIAAGTQVFIAAQPSPTLVAVTTEYTPQQA